MRSINWDAQADIVMERISIQERLNKKFILTIAAAASFIIISIVSFVAFSYYQGIQQEQYAMNSAVYYAYGYDYTGYYNSLY